MATSSQNPEPDFTPHQRKNGYANVSISFLAKYRDDMGLNAMSEAPGTKWLIWRETFPYLYGAWNEYVEREETAGRQAQVYDEPAHGYGGPMNGDVALNAHQHFPSVPRTAAAAAAAAAATVAAAAAASTAAPAVSVAQAGGGGGAGGGNLSSSALVQPATTAAQAAKTASPAPKSAASLVAIDVFMSSFSDRLEKNSKALR